MAVRQAEHQIVIGPKVLQLTAIGHGAQGKNQYHCRLDLYGGVDEKASSYKVVPTGIEINLVKATNDADFWPRLVSGREKLPFLRIDFKRWRDPDVSSDEDTMKKTLRQNYGDFDMGKYEEEEAKRMVDQLTKEMRDLPFKWDLRKPYLLLYNIFLFFGFLLIVIELCMGFAKSGVAYFPDAYSAVSAKLICCQIAQWFEIGHVLLGYTKGGVMQLVMQNAGRSIVLLLLYSEPRLQDKPFVFYLFATWSLVELFRYPYYLLSVANKPFGLVTWLRYTVWIPLYPLGFLFEGIIIARSMSYFAQTGKYSYTLPNNLNMSIYFPFLLQAYMLCGLIPGILFLMNHMRRQRSAKLGTGLKRKHRVKAE